MFYIIGLVENQQESNQIKNISRIAVTGIKYRDISKTNISVMKRE